MTNGWVSQRKLRWCVSVKRRLDSKDVMLPDTELPASVAASLYPSRINGTTLSLSTSLSLVGMQLDNQMKRNDTQQM